MEHWRMAISSLTLRTMLSINAITVLSTICAVTVTLRLIFRRRIPKGLKLPPGPRGNLLIGNLRDVPTRQEWETSAKWQKEFGDLVYLNVLGTSLLYVHSPEMAHELFEKRSAIYSDRPYIPMLDLVGWYWALAFMPYGEEWRQHRHAFHQKLNSTVLTQYTPVQTKHSRNLLQRLYESPDDWLLHIRHSIGAIIMEIAYGIHILPQNDPYIATAEYAVGVAGTVGAPGSYLVNTIPSLKRLPEWFPGAGFLRQAKVYRKRVLDMPGAPFQFVKKEMAAGTANPSLTAALLEEASTRADGQKVSEEEEELIRNLMGTVYVAGADTTVTTLQIFFFVMLLYPEAQLAAQKELDSIIGSSRLPSFEDRGSLPYVQALCKEVLRWHPILPAALPHRLTQDDVVGEYFIPAGTFVIGNSWGILHSESVYGADTMSFKPERFLNSPNMKDPAAAFGYGRRACPGRAMAENGLFITVASILHVFNIVVPKDASLPDRNKFTPGLISVPAPFKCTLVPRSAAAEALIKQL